MNQTSRNNKSNIERTPIPSRARVLLFFIAYILASYTFVPTVNGLVSAWDWFRTTPTTVTHNSVDDSDDEPTIYDSFAMRPLTYPMIIIATASFGFMEGAILAALMLFTGLLGFTLAWYYALHKSYRLVERFKKSRHSPVRA